MSLQLLSIGQQYLSRGLLWGSLGSIRSAASYFKVKPIRVFGTRKKASRQARIEARRAGVAQRRLEEQQGMLLDVKKQFRMEVKRNSGLGWYRSLQLVKHVEMHRAGPGPHIDQNMRERLTLAYRQIIKGK
ncbi:conserved hypothetical protein [Perkinsus marinus ATCC 50983]|uniref:Uncharacterized protein n=1 Tax=Perkinsus marinus (strain ATCC 50983 / TXsc) TaxID=423536 RepID=C5KJY5_PERM5|nr:conserved hypothetical protein [Perkinsus marinus ATCC 50983]EER15243.1 conserved hypothetical protein [Perkinsus marinus ATCC 50983]|eukprot:XP_002783447.1 conserved hypothetical protein [Perkinsus marinus ATCC 50983]